MAKEKIIGIDLGTSNSEAAVMVGGKPTIVPSAEGATVAGQDVSLVCSVYGRRPAARR